MSVTEAGEAPATHRLSRWRRRRAAALVVRVVVFLAPVAVAAVAGVAASRAVAATTAAGLVARVLLTAAVSVATFFVVERLARRFLPLAALLRLHLVFPDRAPSRFSVALRSTSVRRLEQWVREAHATDDVAVLAEKVVTLAAALNTHDRRTRGHCERTRALADLIVEELHLAPADANVVRWGAFLHDIGKLVVPAEILNKPGKPTAREWEILRSHPVAGARLVAPLRPFLGSGVDAVSCHHENFDGSGYPLGLAGDRLPLAARIVSVADSFEVMTAVRAYKRPLPVGEARAELARRSGSQFDPHVVRAFLTISLGRLHWALGLAAWLAEVPFLTVLPRAAAQLSATFGGAPLAPVALPSIAAASLGALSVVAPVRATAGDTHRPPPPAAARPSPAPAVAPTLFADPSPSPAAGVVSAPTAVATATVAGVVPGGRPPQPLAVVPAAVSALEAPPASSPLLATAAGAPSAAVSAAGTVLDDTTAATTAVAATATATATATAEAAGEATVASTVEAARPVTTAVAGEVAVERP